MAKAKRTAKEKKKEPREGFLEVCGVTEKKEKESASFLDGEKQVPAKKNRRENV